MTYEIFVKYLPWVLNGLSLTCAYLLSNKNVIVGRYIGATAAVGWCFYGYIIDELSFMFANVIFFYIYSSAIYKFNSKRDEYKETFEDLKDEIEKKNKDIERLQRKLNSRIEENNKIVERLVKREKKKIQSQKEKLVKVLKNASDNHKILESLMSEID